MTFYSDENTAFEELAYSEETEEVFPPPPRWTRKRVFYLIIALILIAVMVVYLVLPALQVWLMPPPSVPLAPPINL